MTYALATGISRRRAAYRGTQDGSQHRKRHPGGSRFWAHGCTPPVGGLTPPPGSAEKPQGACTRRCAIGLLRQRLESFPRTGKNRKGYGFNTDVCRLRIRILLAAKCTIDDLAFARLVASALDEFDLPGARRFKKLFNINRLPEIPLLERPAPAAPRDCCSSLV